MACTHLNLVLFRIWTNIGVLLLLAKYWLPRLSYDGFLVLIILQSSARCRGVG